MCVCVCMCACIAFQRSHFIIENVPVRGNHKREKRLLL